MISLIKKILFILSLGFLSIPNTFAIPVNNDTALTVFKNQILVREQIIYMHLDDDPSPANEIHHMIHIPTVLAYGITQDLSVQVTYPFMIHEIDQTLANGKRAKRKTSGFGDLKLIGKYEIYENDGLGKTSNAALLAGIEMPTGDTNDQDSFGKIDRDLQVGKGSWNPIIGAHYNWETFRHEFDATASYMFNTEGHGYEHGDHFHHNLNYQFRIWPWSLEGLEGLPGYWFLGAELNGMFHFKDKERGRTVDASGGYTLFGSPTLQFISRRFIWESSVQLPLIQVTNGEQADHEIMMRTGFRIQF